MNDTGYMKELFEIDPEAREQFINKMFAYYINGKVKIGDSLYILCLRDPLLYGSVVMKIMEHKKSKRVTDGTTTDSPLEIKDRSETLRKSGDSSGE